MFCLTGIEKSDGRDCELFAASRHCFRLSRSSLSTFESPSLNIRQQNKAGLHLNVILDLLPLLHKMRASALFTDIMHLNM